MWQLVEACWALDPIKRPTAKQVTEQFCTLPNPSVDERPVDDFSINFPSQMLSKHPFYALSTAAQNPIPITPPHPASPMPTAMTEYVYSPEAYDRYIRTRNRILNWVSDTKAHSPDRQSSHPFAPFTTGRILADSSHPPSRTASPAPLRGHKDSQQYHDPLFFYPHFGRTSARGGITPMNKNRMSRSQRATRMTREHVGAPLQTIVSLCT